MGLFGSYIFDSGDNTTEFDLIFFSIVAPIEIRTPSPIETNSLVQEFTPKNNFFLSSHFHLWSHPS